MNIVEWFDPKNREHVEAYKHLHDTGTWPQGVAPDDIEFTAQWQISIAMKLAKQYFEDFLI